MVVVAVSGGTGGVGRTMVEELLASGKHEVVILTRTVPEDTPSGFKGKFVAVDYSDIEKTKKTLEGLNVHTIISAINMDSEKTSNSQLQLIEAAEKSNTTKRFVPSEYGIINTEDKLKADPNVQFWINSANALKKTSLQYTRVANGFLMDYWGMPHIKSFMRPFMWAIDMGGRQAALPGDGEGSMTVTYTFDLAKIVVRMLDVDDWPEFSIIGGDDLTFNEMVKIAEEVRGSKFDVKYDTVEQLAKGEITLFTGGQTLDDHTTKEFKGLVAAFGQLNVAGIIQMPKEGRINSRFPDVKFKNFRELVTEAWGGK